MARATANRTLLATTAVLVLAGGWSLTTVLGAGPPHAAKDRPTDRVQGSSVITVDAGVLFDTDSSRLRRDAYPALQKIADTVRQAPGRGRVRIEGHTDDVGEPDYNLRLSDHRARAVETWLTSEGGIANARTYVVAYGEASPLVPNDSRSHRQRNRCVVVVVEP